MNTYNVYKSGKKMLNTEWQMKRVICAVFCNAADKIILEFLSYTTKV